MEKFTYASYWEDYNNSIDEYGNPQQYGDHGDYFINVIEGCGLKVSANSHRLLGKGVGGLFGYEKNRSQVSPTIMKATEVTDSPLKHTGRKLLELYIDSMNTHFPGWQLMERLSDLGMPQFSSVADIQDFRNAARFLLLMMEF